MLEKQQFSSKVLLKTRLRSSSPIWHGVCILCLPMRSDFPDSRPRILAGEGTPMLYWAAVFLVIALIAAVFGFGGIAASAAGIAKVLFFVFLVLFVISLLFGGLRRGPTV
jgi:uncharacterized membrane protein YtjA (UPF0391 family)